MSIAAVTIGAAETIPDPGIPVLLASNEGETTLKAEVSIDGHGVQSILAAASTSFPLGEAFSLVIPDRPRQLVIKGTVSVQGKTHAVTQMWNIADAREHTQGLWDSQIPISQRLATYLDTVAAFETDEPGYQGNRRKLPRQPVDRTGRFEELNAKFGRKIPKPLRDLADVALDVGDSRFQSVLLAQTVAATMRTEWELDPSRVFSATLIKSFERSVVVFTEVGDGLGLLAWDPGARQSTEAWYWIAQGDSEPEYLKDRHGKPVSDELALLSTLDRCYINSQYFEALTEAGVIGEGDKADEHAPWLIIDSSHPALTLQLSIRHNDRDGSVELSLMTRHFHTSW